MRTPRLRPLTWAPSLFAVLVLGSGCGANPEDSSSDDSSSDEGAENEDAEASDDNGSSASASDSPTPTEPSASSDVATPDNSVVSDIASASSGVECTSGDYWTRGNHESPLMHPGGECIACHTAEREGPRYAIAGTLYVGLHEPDDCNGVDPSYGAQVIITDANGDEFRLDVNSAGNFMSSRAVAMPYRAKVVYNGTERIMATPQSIGECNSCHTQDGASAAPGRIQLPL